MTNSKRTKTAAELMALLNADPSFRARSEAMEAEWRMKAAVFDLDERSLVGDLAAVGCHVKSVWDLVNTSESYPHAIPVLMDHLSMNHLARTREGVARALTVKEARGIATNAVLSAFRRSTSMDEWELRWTLANALTIIADPSIRGELQQLYDSGQYPNEERLLKKAIQRAAKSP